MGEGARGRNAARCAARIRAAGAGLAVLAAVVLAFAGRELDAAEAGALPRFMTLRAEEVNARTGPGTRHPVEWRFTRRDLPVEVIQTFEHWRKIRDWQGAEGWVHQSMLSGKRGVIVVGGARMLRRRPAADAAPVAEAEAGVIARLLECERAWCRVEAEGHRGWLRRDEVWGVYANERVE